MDTDVFFLKGPGDMAALDQTKQGFFIGRDFGDGDGHCNNAVFDLPKTSRTFSVLETFFEEGQPVEPGVLPAAYGADLNKAVDLGQSKPFEMLPWGWTGPNLVTSAIAHAGEIGLCQPTRAFYPANIRDLVERLKRTPDIRAAASEDSIAVHLWGRDLRDALPDGFEKQLEQA